MALFVELQSVEKNCPIIVNLDHIAEIAPLKAGGCMLYLVDNTNISNNRPCIQVRDDYSQFKQFAMQTVTSEDIAKRFPPAAKKDPAKKNINEELTIPKL